MSDAALTDSTTPAVSPASSLAPTFTSPTNTRSPSRSCAGSVMPTTTTPSSTRAHSWEAVYFNSAGRFMKRSSFLPRPSAVFIFSARRFDRPDSVDTTALPLVVPAIIHLGASLLGRSSHLPAYSDGPPFPARVPYVCLFDVAPDGGYRVSPCQAARRIVRHTEMAVSVRLLSRPPDSLVSVALFLGFPQPTCGRAIRTAVSRHPALWSPD